MQILNNSTFSSSIDTTLGSCVLDDEAGGVARLIGTEEGVPGVSVGVELPKATLDDVGGN